MLYASYLILLSSAQSSSFDFLFTEFNIFICSTISPMRGAYFAEESLPFEKNRFFKNMPILRKYTEDKILAQEFLKLSNYSDIKLLGSKK